MYGVLCSVCVCVWCVYCVVCVYVCGVCMVYVYCVVCVCVWRVCVYDMWHVRAPVRLHVCSTVTLSGEGWSKIVPQPGCEFGHGHQ